MNFQPLCYSPNDAFEGRNQLYGAYLLRSRYEKRIFMAVFFAIFTFTVGLGAPILYFSWIGEQATAEKYSGDHQLADLPPPEKEEIPLPATPPPPPVEVPKVKEIAFLPPEPSPTESEKMPEQSEFKNDTKIGNKDVEGEEFNGDLSLPEVPSAPAIVDVKPTPAEEKPFSIVQQMPEPSGGMKALYRFLSNKMVYPRRAAKQGIEGKVFIRFVVGKDGKIGNIEVTRGMQSCPECNEEAMRVVKMMPAWKAGMQNGNPVSVYYTLPITFEMSK